MKKYLRRMTPIAERFERKVDRSGGPDSCHIWLGGRKYKGKRGYGTIGLGRRGDGSIGTHRLAFQLAFGEIPDGLDVLHKCDNPPCVNPRHLFSGTAKTNSDDMMAKGRHHTGVRPRGSTHHAPKLLPHLKEIRERLARGESQRSVAKLFGVVSNAVRNIALGRVYAEEP